MSNQLALFPQWQTREMMPGDTLHYLEYPEYNLCACVSPLSTRIDRVPYAYTYFVIKVEPDGSRTRIAHWLDTGNKHKVSLEDGKRICEDAIAQVLNSLQVSEA